MNGDIKVIEHLNQALANELVAINQYFLHARMLKAWGFLHLAEHEYRESIHEMKHADMLIERILFLKGLPNLQKLGKLTIGENVLEILRADLQVERAAYPALVAGIAYCEKSGDYISRELLRRILDSEEEHIDWTETQLELVDKVGLPNYLQSQIVDSN